MSYIANPSRARLASWLKDVEELTCFLEGDLPEAMLLVGKGAKIAHAFSSLILFEEKITLYILDFWQNLSY